MSEAARAYDTRPQGGPITYTESIEAARQELAKAASAGENLLMPTDSLNNVPLMHKVSVERIRLSPDPANKDIYPQGSRFALSKDGILKLSSCAGVQWDYDHSGRIDRQDDPNYCAWRMVGAVQKLDGSWLPLQGSYDLDFLVIEEDLRELFKKKSDNWNKPQAQKDGYVESSTKTELLKMKRHKVARCETGAMLRAIRGLLNIKGTYSQEELQKPFVIARLVFQPDYADPLIKAQAVALAFKAMQGVFGIQAPSFPPPRQIPQATIDLEENGNGTYGTDPEPDLPPEEPVTIPTGKPEPPPEDPIEAQIRGYREAERADQIQTIDALIDRKGYDRKLLKKPLDKHGEKALEDFFLYLVKRPDKQETIPFPE